MFTVCLKGHSKFNPLYTGNPKRVLWPTVKTKMKCRIMRHSSWYTLFFKGLVNLQNTFFKAPID